jgi:anti-sigma regulatory factor (Ser/Thr protein kinase)
LRVAGVEPDEARDIVIAANEALANAIEHGSPSPDAVVTLTARQDEPRVVVAVRDRGQWRTRAPRPDRGRGIQVMRAIMDTVDFQPSPNGTTVTMERAPGE